MDSWIDLPKSRAALPPDLSPSQMFPSRSPHLMFRTYSTAALTPLMIGLVIRPQGRRSPEAIALRNEPPMSWIEAVTERKSHSGSFRPSNGFLNPLKRSSKLPIHEKSRL